MTDLAEPAPAGTDDPPFFPMTRTCPFDPPPEYGQLREQTPVFKVRLRWNSKEVWALTRHEDVKRVLGDASMSSNWKHPGYPLQVPVPDEILQFIEIPMVGQDPPGHTARRRLLIPELTAKRAHALRPRIQQMVDEHIDRMLAAGPPGDLVEGLAFPVPALLFCELLGVPAEDAPRFRRWVETLVRADVEQLDMMDAMAELEEYLDALVTKRETDPEDNLLRRVVVKNQQDGELNRVDIVNLAKNLVFGGYDTTSNMIALGMLVLLQHPEQLEQLKADPALVPAAVEELIRFLSVADSSPARVVMQEDIEVGGVLIRKGEGVMALTAAANRDPAAFEEPDRLDIHRDSRGHAAFGFGIHQCPGANLVRTELEVVFTTLLARMPKLQLAVPFEELRFKTDTLVTGVAGPMPVTW